MLEDEGGGVKRFNFKRDYPGGQILVVARFFPDKCVTLAAYFDPKSKSTGCEVQVSLWDDKGRNYKQFPKVQFHSDGRVVGYGYVDGAVKFRALLRDRERFHSPRIAVDGPTY